jgi:hypothetical protein
MSTSVLWGLLTGGPHRALRLNSNARPQFKFNHLVEAVSMREARRVLLGMFQPFG